MHSNRDTDGPRVSATFCYFLLHSAALQLRTRCNDAVDVVDAGLCATFGTLAPINHCGLYKEMVTLTPPCAACAASSMYPGASRGLAMQSLATLCSGMCSCLVQVHSLTVLVVIWLWIGRGCFGAVLPIQRTAPCACRLSIQYTVDCAYPHAISHLISRVKFA